MTLELCTIIAFITNLSGFISKINVKFVFPVFQILPSTEINIKGEKISNVSVSDSSTTNGAETNSHSTSTHSDDGKDKSMTGTPQTVIRTGTLGGFYL